MRRSRRSRRALLCTLPLLAACASAGRTEPGPAAVAAGPAFAPSVEELRRDLFPFAADSFRGREAGTPDELRAARFLAGRLATDGVEPAGDSGYYQRVPLTRVALGPASRIAVVGGPGARTLDIGREVVPFVGEIAPGAPEPRLNAEGPLVFAGYGVRLPTRQRDDLVGLDLAGKVVVVVNGAPPGADSATRAELEGSDAVGLRLQGILPRGPAAVVVVLTGKSLELYDQLAPEIGRQLTPRKAGPPRSDAERPFPMIVLARLVPGSPLLPAGWPRDDRPRALPGRFSARVEVRHEDVTGYNVVGVVRGADPVLRDTYVAYGAHFDHIGIQPPVNGDSIANGADDDGSGSVGLLALARGYARGPRPRRSVLFVWHGAEEKGLLGSEYFASHPTVPLRSIVAQINADMIGRNAPDSLFIVGPGAAPEGRSLALGRLADSVNASLARPFVFDRTWDSPTHPEHIYERSDHYSYAKRGVPVVFFTDGDHPDYHKVSDEPGKIDFAKMARVVELLHRLGWAVATRTAPPR